MNKKILKPLIGIILLSLSGCGKKNERQEVTATSQTAPFTTISTTAKEILIEPLTIYNISDYYFSSNFYRVGYSDYFVKVNDQFRDSNELLYLLYEHQPDTISLVSLKYDANKIIPFEATNANQMQHFIKIETFYFAEAELLEQYAKLHKILYANDQFFVYIGLKISQEDFASDYALSFCKDSTCEELVAYSKKYFELSNDYALGTNPNPYIFDFIESFEIRR